MKTILQLWQETKTHKIDDPDYQLFCKVLEEKTARTVKEFGYIMPDLWNLYPLEAIEAINNWAAYESKQNPHYLIDWKEEQYKRFQNS